jgi:hypothetical protein
MDFRKGRFVLEKELSFSRKLVNGNLNAAAFQIEKVLLLALKL